MEQNSAIISLFLVVIITFIIPVLLKYFNLSAVPIVVTEIAVGLVIGKSGFNLITEDSWLKILSQLGFIFLMFLSGLEIDFDVLFLRPSGKKRKYNPVFVSFLIFILILCAAIGLSLLLVKIGLVKHWYLMFLIISTVSLGVVLPVLKEKRLIETELGQVVLLVTALADVTSMLLLTVLVMIQSPSYQGLFLFLLFFAIFFIVYRFLKIFMKQTELLKSMSKGTVQIGTRAIFALILFFVVLSEVMGVESILGAFLAGIIVSLMSPPKNFVNQLESFGYGFLIPIFFVTVGAEIDLRLLLNSENILFLVPLLFILMYLAKIIPALVLKFWHTWNEVFAVGVLISSKLSLVIAASTVALAQNLITRSVNDALILVAVFTSLVSPVIFNRLMPQQKVRRNKVSIVGANNFTLPASLDLMRNDYEVKVYHSIQEKNEEQDVSSLTTKFPLQELEALNIKNLEQKNAFSVDIMILATNYDRLNIELAHKAKAEGVKRIIVRVEDPYLRKDLTSGTFTVFSTLFASRILLKALVEQPHLVRLISETTGLMKEVSFNNPKYDNFSLRQLPFLGDTLVLRIYRGDSSIIPHGDTKLQMGDVLLICGSLTSVQTIIKELS
jgi:Kef-type K+ transport system membrane component KefB/Trk K+ transport system NAD-binding subunit